jgi:transketolase
MATSERKLHSFTFAAELADMADERDDIVLLTADLRTSNRGTDFRDRHPDRFFDLGIAEQNMVSVAAGLAACGYVPYVSTFAAFVSLLCAEQLRTDLAYPGLPVRVLAHHAGISLGFYGTSHHAVEDIAVTRAMAGMTVVAPCDGAILRSVLRSTVDHPGPVYFRLGRGGDAPVYDDPPEVPLGGMVRLRDGRDLAIVATGIGVAAALAAARDLTRDGIDAAVYDAVFLKPLDEAAIAAASATGALLTVEEHNVIGGLGAAVAEVIARRQLDVAFATVGLPDAHALIAPPTHLYRHYGLTPEGVAEAARKVLAR